MQISNVANCFHGISFLWLFLLTFRVAFHMVIYIYIYYTVVDFKTLHLNTQKLQQDKCIFK